jgi:hypothetical protein
MSTRRYEHPVLSLAMFLILPLSVTPFLTACGAGAGATRPAETPEYVRPAWIPRPNRDHPDVLYVTASCRDAASLAAGKDCALRDAGLQLAEQIGRAGPEVRGAYAEAEYSELRSTPAGEVFDVWLLVAWPRSEIAMGRARVEGMVLLGVACEAQPQSACDGIAERIEASVAGSGLKPVPPGINPGAMGMLIERKDRAAEAGRKAGAARVLLVRLTGRFLTESGGEYYAEATGGFELVDSADGKVIDAFDPGTVKGAHLGRDKAVRKALDNAAARIAEALGRKP